LAKEATDGLLVPSGKDQARAVKATKRQKEERLDLTKGHYFRPRRRRDVSEQDELEDMPLVRSTVCTVHSTKKCAPALKPIEVIDFSGGMIGVKSSIGMKRVFGGRKLL
jgi:hypothetical protein